MEEPPLFRKGSFFSYCNGGKDWRMFLWVKTKKREKEFVLLLGWDRHLCEWQTHFMPFISHWPEILSWPNMLKLWSWLIVAHGESIMHFPFPSLCSMTSCWELEISHGGSVYTTETGKHPKLGFSFLKEHFSNTPLTWPLLNESVFRNVEWQMNSWGLLLSSLPQGPNQPRDYAILKCGA